MTFAVNQRIKIKTGHTDSFATASSSDKSTPPANTGFGGPVNLHLGRPALTTEASRRNMRKWLISRVSRDFFCFSDLTGVFFDRLFTAQNHERNELESGGAVRPSQFQLWQKS
jgi:hypothetical protein